MLGVPQGVVLTASEGGVDGRLSAKQAEVLSSADRAPVTLAKNVSARNQITDLENILLNSIIPLTRKNRMPSSRLR